MFDGKARMRPGMKDASLGDKVISQLLDTVPGHPILLAPSSERAPPKVGDVVAERTECTTVCRHRVIRKEAGCDLPQPFALFWDRLVHPLSHVLLDFLSFARMRSPRDFRFSAKRP
jgi:hypothetical protein